MPVWALVLSVMLAIVYVLPSGFIYAMTGQGVCIVVCFCGIGSRFGRLR